MALEHYSPGQRVAVITNRTTAEAAGIPFVVASGIVGDPTGDGRLWVTLELMGQKGLPQMVDEQDVVGHTFHQPLEGERLPPSTR